MAKKQYNVKTVTRPARPRNKRMREDGYVSSTVVVGGGALELGAGHIHANKDLLDTLVANDQDYLFITHYEEVPPGPVPVEEDVSDEPQYEPVLHHVKAGYADNAGHAVEADHAMEADHALEADFADDSDNWDGHDFYDYLDQPVRREDDVHFGNVTLNGFSTPDYASGPTGFGGRMDGGGNAELDSLTLRRFLEVPELRYNRVDVTMGDVWYAPCAGVIAEIDADNQLVTLKLEDGEIGTAHVGDICMGIFHMSDESLNASEDYDDSRGNRRFAGFATSYFRITEVLGVNNSQFKYEHRPVSASYPRQVGPCAAMTFVGFGSFTNKERQTSRYETRTYQRYLKNVSDWEFTSANIAAQFGDLSNLSVHGLHMEGYSAYLDNIYMRGLLRSLDGTFVIDTQAKSLLMASGESGMGLAFTPERGLKIGKVFNPATGEFETEYDLDMIDEAMRLAREAAAAAEAAGKAASDLDEYVDGAFKDGIIDNAEAVAIEKYINAINATMLSITATCDNIYANSYLTGPAKTDLTTKFGLLTGARNTLIAAINNAISDRITTAPEKEAVDMAYGTFNTALANLNKAIEVANKAIQDKIKGYADAAQNTADLISQDVRDVIDTLLPDLQGQIDGSIMSWEGEAFPTLENYPASEWDTEIERARHRGDYYDRYVTVDGERTVERYKFSYQNSTFQWVRVADSGAALALSEARKALGLTGTKAAIFYGDTPPVPPYDINDVWIKTNGSIYLCNVTRGEGAIGSAGDWMLVNEATVRLSAMASDGIITREEKSALRNTRSQIQKEYAVYQVDAVAFEVDISNLTTAWENLDAFLTDIVRIDSDTDTELSAESITAYNKAFADYYAEVSRFCNRIADKIAQDKTDEIKKRLEAIASDWVITREEKSYLRNLWLQLTQELASYNADATKYDVSIVALQDAYDTLGGLLNGVIKISEDSDTTITESQRTTYNKSFADYHAEVARFCNLIASKIAQATGNEFEFLKKAFSDQSTDVSGGVVLSGFIGIKNGSKVSGGISNGTVDETEVPLIFAGANSLLDAFLTATYYLSREGIQKMRDAARTRSVTFGNGSLVFANIDSKDDEIEAFSATSEIFDLTDGSTAFGKTDLIGGASGSGTIPVKSATRAIEEMTPIEQPLGYKEDAWRDYFNLTDLFKVGANAVVDIPAVKFDFQPYLYYMDYEQNPDGGPESEVRKYITLTSMRNSVRMYLKNTSTGKTYLAYEDNAITSASITTPASTLRTIAAGEYVIYADIRGDLQWNPHYSVPYATLSGTMRVSSSGSVTTQWSSTLSRSKIFGNGFLFAKANNQYCGVIGDGLNFVLEQRSGANGVRFDNAGAWKWNNATGTWTALVTGGSSGGAGNVSAAGALDSDCLVLGAGGMAIKSSSYRTSSQVTNSAYTLPTAAAVYAALLPTVTTTGTLGADKLLIGGGGKAAVASDVSLSEVKQALEVLSQGGGGSSPELAQAMGVRADIAMSQDATSRELQQRVEKVPGKGLSTNDYTFEDRLKVAALRTNGSGSQFLADDGLYRPMTGGGSGGELIIQHSEHIVGKWVDERYGERLDLWERIVSLPASELGSAGSTTTVTLEEDLQLEPDTYLRVVNAMLTGSGRYHTLTGSIEAVYQEGNALKAQIKVPAASAGTQFSLQLQYVKYQGDVLRFELRVPQSTDLTSATLSFPVLKYFKHVLYTPTCDDSNVTAYCNIWAFMNHKKVWNTAGRKYFHKGRTPDPSDTFSLYPEPFDFDNGTGRRVRYSFSCAIWPTLWNEWSKNGFIIDSSTSLTNKYICWSELREMLDYGVSMMYHNVDENTWDKNDPAQIARGYAQDRQRCYDKLGVWLKLLGQPDGNTAYIEAAHSTPLVHFMRQSNPAGPRVYLDPAPDLYHVGTRAAYSDGGNAGKLLEIGELMNSANPYWTSSTWHETSHLDPEYSFFKSLYDTYSANAATDGVWVTSWDNAYEWFYMRRCGVLTLDLAHVRTEGGYKYIPVRAAIPSKESFSFRDISLLFATQGAVSSCEVVNLSGNVLRAESAVVDGKVRINLNFDPKSLERAERYTALFESSADPLDRESALYFTSWLSDGLAQPLLDRINGVADVEITSLQISGPATLSNGATGTFTVVASPANNTHMNEIAISVSAGLSFVSKSISRNTLTALYKATAEGPATFAASYKQSTASHNLTVDSTPMPSEVLITGIEITGDDTIAGVATKQYTVTCLPANNTQMADVVVTTIGGISVKSKTTQNNVITVNIQGSANGVATLRAARGSVVGERSITVSEIAAAPLRAVMSFGHDWQVATGGVYDANGGYTKVRVLAGKLSGTVFGTDGTQVGAYGFSANVGISGSTFAGQVTGDDSALYKDYAIKNFYYPTVANGGTVDVTFTGFAPGTYLVKYFLNTSSTEYSKGATYTSYTLITAVGSYPVVMPQDNRTMWCQNFDKTVAAEIVVGADGTFTFSVVPNRDGSSTMAPFQILDIEKIG